MYNVRYMYLLLNSMLMYKRDNKRIVKSDFVTLYVAFRGSILTNFHQPQKQTGHCRKNLLYNYITFLNYLINQVIFLFHMFSFLVVTWFFRLCHHPIIIKNRILDDTTKGTTLSSYKKHLKPSDFLCYFKNKKNHLKCTNTQRQTCKIPHHIEILIPCS